MNILVKHFSLCVLFLSCINAIETDIVSVGVIAASIEPASVDCIDLFIEASKNHCTQLNTSEISGIVISKCQASDGTGVFILHRRNDFVLGQDVFRVRVSGPEIFVLNIFYCGANLAYAPFNLIEDGEYIAEVVQLYRNFTLLEIPKPLHLALSECVLTKTSLKIPCACFGISEHCRKCSPKDLQQIGGRWLTQNPQRMPHLSHRYPNLNESADITRAIEFDDTVLRWQPQNCRLHRDRDAFRKALSKNLKLCFYGDSHMRHILRAARYILDEVEVRLPEGKTDTSILNGKGLTYERVTFGNSTFNFTGCSKVLFNFGQWPLSYKSDTGHPWNARHYLEALEQVAAQLLDAKHSGIDVFWATTNAMNFHRKVEAGTDWRIDPFFLNFNRLANAVMREASIPVINTYTMTTILEEYSYDSSHFIGYVGHWIAWVVLEAMLYEHEGDHQDS